MSLTVSRGLTDAGRWTAVATTVAEHLEAMAKAAKRRMAVQLPPKGALEAARRFFQYVLEGIELDQGSPRAKVGGSSSPSMAGFSNLSIAVNVMRSAKGTNPVEDLDALKRQISALLETLDRLQKEPFEALSANDVQSLITFLRELQRQGEIERDATFAAQEHPRLYSAF